MAVTVREDGMSADSNNNKKDCSHEYSLYLDRQLQNKLLQADEALDQDQNYVKLGNNFTGSNNCNGKSNKNIEFHDGISGWISDQKVVPRKVDKESKPTNKDNFIYPWRDSRRQQENFVFQHYADIRKYIEQYRSQNCCHISSSPYPSGETRKLAFQHSAPPQPSPYQQSVWNGHTTPPASTPNSYQYARRENSLTANLSTNVTPCSCVRCSKTGNYQKPGSASQAHRYRLTSVYNPVSNTQSDSRSDIQSDSEKGERCQTPRINSGIHPSFGRTAGRAPGKSASSNFKPYPLQALTIAWRLRRQNANASATSQSAGSKSTLQNLATLAEKQRLQTVRKVTDTLGLITETQGTNDLLTANEPPIQGCAIRKSSNFAVTGPSNLTRSHTDKSWNGLSTEEKIEVLRSINKKPKLPKPKQPKLKYMQDAFLSDPKSAEKEELYQQRRIKHLIEQARLKRHKQMNWIHEAHEAMKAKYGPVLSARILSPEDCCIWSSDSDNESGAEDYETGLSRYGISVPPKGYVWTMFNQGPRRSNTTLYQP